MGVEIGRFVAGGTIEVRFISRFPGLRLLQQPGAGRALISRFFVASSPRSGLVDSRQTFALARQLHAIGGQDLRGNTFRMGERWRG